MADDRTQIGLTLETQALCQRMKDDGLFKDLVDGYRLGITLALSRKAPVPEVRGTRTMFSVVTVDPSGVLRDAISELHPEEADRPYAYAERLAEHGVAQLGRLWESKQLRFAELFDQIAATPS